MMVGWNVRRGADEFHVRNPHVFLSLTLRLLGVGFLLQLFIQDALVSRLAIDNVAELNFFPLFFCSPGESVTVR